MGKDKKKKGKKGEKATNAAVHAYIQESAASLQSVVGNQVEDHQANLLPQEEPKPFEEPPHPEPMEYKEPVLPQLIVESYEGEKVNGLYEGEGIAKFQGGNVYHGMFSEGLMHGQGTYTWADGVKYKGNFVKNVQMQHGSYTWPDGSVYEGEVKNGIRHGFGMYKCGTYPVSYVGQWFEGRRHGKGTIYYNQEGSSWYEGDFVNNIKSGWGIRCYKSGNIYEGQWERGVRHGEGRMRWLTTNQEYTGQWVNGIQHGFGTHTWYLKRIPGSQYPLRNEFVGDFVNGERHGHGKFFFASGAMYDGQWAFNKKHGMGKLVFKNGRVYEGEFVYDHIAEYPAFQTDDMNTQDPSGICTPSPFGTKSIKVVDGPGSLPVLGSTIEIDISTLLAQFPEKDRAEEIKQTEFAVLRHISELRKIYTFYSSLGCDHSLDYTFLMTKLQFWRFLKDCQFHHCNITLADMDRILNDKKLLEEIHSPYETMLLRIFLTYLIHLSFHIYNEEFGDMSPRLFKCFSKMMTKNILPNACQIKGILFSGREETVHVLNYTNRCWMIYRDFCRPNALPPYEPTMKMRHFIWMLKDLRLISKQLTATQIVDILAKDSPCVRNGDCTNLEKELVFLEFFEALLDCAELYVTDEMLKQQVEWASQPKSSSRLSSYSEGTKISPLTQELSSRQSFQTRSTSSGEASNETGYMPGYVSTKCSASKIVHFVDALKTKEQSKDGGKEEKTSQYSSKSPHQSRACSVQGNNAEKLETAKDDIKDQLNLRMSRIYIFFVNNFFANYKHLQVVKETILDNQVQEVKLAEQRRIEEEEEEARLYAMWEAEEARKLEEAAAEKAALELEESLSKEAEEGSVQIQSPPKEEPPILPLAPPSSKAATAGKKKKK